MHIEQFLAHSKGFVKVKPLLPLVALGFQDVPSPYKVQSLNSTVPWALNYIQFWISRSLGFILLTLAAKVSLSLPWHSALHIKSACV